MKLLAVVTAMLLLSGCANQQRVSPDYMAFPTNEDQENTLMREAIKQLGSDDYVFSNMYLVRNTKNRGSRTCGFAQNLNSSPNILGVVYESGSVSLFEGGNLPHQCDLTAMPGSNGFKLSAARTYTPTAKDVAVAECENSSANASPRLRGDAEITSRHFELLGCVTIESGHFSGGDYSINHTHNSARFFNSPPEHGVGDASYWAVSCEDDAITDQRSCTIRRDGIFVYWSDGYRIMTTGDIYPLSTMHFRVDSNPAFSAAENNGLSVSHSRRLIEQIKNGREVTTRYTEWPYGTNVDTTFPTTGFSEAIEFLESIR